MKCSVGTINLGGDKDGPFGNVSKDLLSFIVIGTDIAIVIMLIIFTDTLNRLQNAFVLQYRDETIEPIDFTVTLTNLPYDDFFNGNDDLLRVRLWNQIEALLRDQAKKEDPELDEAVYDKENRFLISDITFARKFNAQAEFLHSYQELRMSLIQEMSIKT